MKIDIFGSCVSRDPFALEQPPFTPVESYLARQSFIGIGDPPVAFDEAWFADVNPWERRCVLANLTKGEASFPFSPDADHLLIDYIDERFDLLDLAGSRLVMTKHLMQDGFTRHYAGQYRVLRRHSAEAAQAWAAGARLFFERAIARYGAGNIILHKARWAATSRHVDGREVPFEGAQGLQVADNNRLLDGYHELTCAMVPGIRVIEVESRFLHADPDHRWSKEPFHCRRDYYDRFLELFQQTLGKSVRSRRHLNRDAGIGRGGTMVRSG